MNNHFQKIILKATGAKDLYEIEEIQNLWSGYGKILRYELTGTNIKSVVVKNVRFPKAGNRSRGGNTDISHQRKLKSYKVEMAWYKQWSEHCGEDCRVPKCFALESQGDEILMVLEDLDDAGFSSRRSGISFGEIKTCLLWLANFHATFMGEKPDNLWKVGTYWHLSTRPDELKALTDPALKNAAGKIDQQLQQCRFKTFVHGDAKLANFCFTPDGKNVAAVDFQYVGGGCGMKDVAYFTGSCMSEEECESWESEVLHLYFQALKDAVQKQKKTVDMDALEKEWRRLYPVAWTDFHRFIKGWSPGFWVKHSYSERLAREVVEKL
ncbi:MAG: DUF1679 domain-containing protein [bacterium]|nr:DUF1679 domain-containing protein [bacterium]